jgi:hypothetical protein
MKIYLAGKMRGEPDLNYPAFNAAAQKLRLEGHEVFNPAAANLESWPINKILAYELTWLCEQAEAIALLPGWSYSLGARAEHATALAIGIEVILL